MTTVRAYRKRNGTRVRKHYRVHITKQFERHRIRDPSEFKKGSFRTPEYGKTGFSKRITGQLKRNGWATQSLLISHKEPMSRKRKLRKQARKLR